jgi:hypothetical protein
VAWEQEATAYEYADSVNPRGGRSGGSGSDRYSDEGEYESEEEDGEELNTPQALPHPET